MQPAGVSGTVTISDQSLRGKNPTEILGALSEVCGEFTVDHSTVFLVRLIVFMVVV